MMGVYSRENALTGSLYTYITGSLEETYEGGSIKRVDTLPVTTSKH